MRRDAACHLLLLLLLCAALLVDLMDLMAAAAAAAVTNGSGNGFLLVALPPAGVYQAATAEAALLAALPARFPNASGVRCVDMRVGNSTSASSPPALLLPFDLLFLIGDSPLHAAPLAVDLAALQTDLSQTLPATTSTVALRVLTASDVAAAYGALPALGQSVAAPPPTAAFLRVDMSFRNLLAPANLTQSLLFQTRRGLQRFLSLVSMAQVVATGPPLVPPSSVLLLTQSFFVVLNNNASDATLENRQRLANLLLYGDPARLVATADGNGTAPTPSRPAMFLDLAVDAAVDAPPDPIVLLTLPFVFSALSVDVLPAGNAPPPAQSLPAGAVLVPATPIDELLAGVRRRHRFQYEYDAALSNRSSNADADANANATAGCPAGGGGGGICVQLRWTNALASGTTFWLESVESADALAWSGAPGVALCAASETPRPLRAGPLVAPGNATAPDWFFSPWRATDTSPPTTRLAFALHLRSVGNETRLTVEIAADIRSAVQAATTVTSVARRVDATGPATPVFASESNVVVAFDALFRAATSELVLSLELQASQLTRKDTSQPCAHCQNLFEWCAAHAPCQALAQCVLRDGLEAAQLPATLLQAPSLLDAAAVDVSPYLRACLGGGDAAVDRDALLLFASAVRCQLQRQCAFRTPADYALAGLDDRVLLWDASDGVVELTYSAADSAATTTTITTTLALRLPGGEGDAPLCSFSPAAFASPRAIEDFVARQCAFASYLGRVAVTVTVTAAAPSNASTLLALRFQDLVGPLPTVEFVSPAASATARVVVAALPALRLRLERADFATALPPLPAPTPVDVCRATCRPLALDACLRDLKCVAFTDCIARFTPSASPAAPSVGDALLGVFARRVVGESLSLRDAVDSCHAQQTAGDAAWRVLVAASACFARHACPLSLQGVLLPAAADGDAVVGAWRVSPASPTVVQRLIYEQQDGAEPVATSVPLQLVDSAGAVVATAASAALDAAAVEAALRALLQTSDVSVTLVADAEPSNGLRAVQWEVAYAFWLGRPPRFVDATLAPRWRLVTLPGDAEPDFVVEMVAAANTSGSDNALLSVVEMAASVAA